MFSTSPASQSPGLGGGIWAFVNIDEEEKDNTPDKQDPLKLTIDESSPSQPSPLRRNSRSNISISELLSYEGYALRESTSNLMLSELDTETHSIPLTPKAAPERTIPMPIPGAMINNDVQQTSIAVEVDIQSSKISSKDRKSQKSRDRSYQREVESLQQYKQMADKIDSNALIRDISDARHLCNGKVSHIHEGVWRKNRVVIKKLRSGPDYQRTSYKKEILFETKLLTAIAGKNCKNIVNILGSGVASSESGEDLPFILLERLNGGSLTFKLQKKRMMSKRPFRSDLECYGYMIALASALQFIHYDFDPSVHVIHRDLKPDNVAFDEDGELKLIDFGLSVCIKRFKDSTETYQMTGETGSLRYMAPEAISRKSYNEKVDVYSFGILAWEMLVGNVPHARLRKDNFVEHVVHQQERPPLVIDYFGNRIRAPNVLKDLIEACWEHQWQKRPRITHVLEALKDIVAHVKEERKNGDRQCVVC